MFSSWGEILGHADLSALGQRVKIQGKGPFEPCKPVSALQNYWVLPRETGSGTLRRFSLSGSHLVQRRDGSRRVAAEAVAALHGGDDALEVGAVEQLGELQEAVAQHEELGDTGRGENNRSHD